MKPYKPIEKPWLTERLTPADERAWRKNNPRAYRKVRVAKRRVRLLRPGDVVELMRGGTVRRLGVVVSEGSGADAWIDERFCVQLRDGSVVEERIESLRLVRPRRTTTR